MLGGAGLCVIFGPSVSTTLISAHSLMDVGPWSVLSPPPHEGLHVLKGGHGRWEGGPGLRRQRAGHFNVAVSLLESLLPVKY